MNPLLLLKSYKYIIVSQTITFVWWIDNFFKINEQNLTCAVFDTGQLKITPSINMCKLEDCIRTVITK